MTPIYKGDTRGSEELMQPSKQARRQVDPAAVNLQPRDATQDYDSLRQQSKVIVVNHEEKPVFQGKLKRAENWLNRQGYQRVEDRPGWWSRVGKA